MVLEFILATASIIGGLFVAKQKEVGFWIWIGTNAGWIYVGLRHHMPWQAIMFVFYTLTSVYSIYKWRSMRRAEERNKRIVRL